MFSVPVEMSSRPHRSHLCVPPLQVSSGAEGGMFGCNKQETTSASPGRARPPCAIFWGSAICRDAGTGSSGLKEKEVPSGSNSRDEITWQQTELKSLNPLSSQ